MAKRKGKVIWSSNSKGLGFAGTTKDVFCHFTAIQGDGYASLKEGESVEFDVVEGARGPQADNVTGLD